MTHSLILYGAIFATLICCFPRSILNAASEPKYSSDLNFETLETLETLENDQNRTSINGTIIIGGACSLKRTEDLCGSFAQCISSRCTCKFGFTQLNETDCTAKQCKEDQDCRLEFATNQTRCRTNENIFGEDISQCECFPETPDQFVMLNEQTQRCETYSTPSCSSQTDCGYNSTCESGKCRCTFAHIPLSFNSSSTGCGDFRCANDQECESIFVNTRCSQNVRRCVCKAWHEWNAEEGVCEKQINWFVYGVIGSVVVIFVGPVLFFVTQRLLCGRN